MRIDVSITTSESLVSDLKELERDFPKQVLRRVVRDVIPPLERRLDRVLANEPPRRNAGSPTFIWSFNPAANARARRWFFAHFPKGYTRTGQMAKSWMSEIFLDGDTIVISVTNPAPGSSFVYGDDARSQIPGHATTGWPETDDIITRFGAETEDDIEDLAFAIVEEYL